MRSEAIVRAVIDLALALGLKTIAEGVETEAQALSLTQSGANFLQGYLFSRPIDAEQFTLLLSRAGARHQAVETGGLASNPDEPRPPITGKLNRPIRSDDGQTIRPFPTDAA